MKFQNAERRGQKRQRDSSQQNDSGGKRHTSLTLRHYFKRDEKAAADSNDASPCVSSYEADMTRAISLTLESQHRTETGSSSTLAAQEAVHVAQESTGKGDSDQECPICGSLFKITIDELQAHVNECLDKYQLKTQQQQDNTAPNDDIADQKRKQSSSWTSLFRKAQWKISGIWHSKSVEIPGMSEIGSTTAWFGDETWEKPGVPVKRTCPLYKKLPGTRFTVDAFCYGNIPGCQGYFLSHYHSDHYRGLTKNWTHGPIYCSEITANCIRECLEVNTNYVKPLPMDKECKIPGSNVIVCLIDANHCPGAVIFLFKVPMENGEVKRYLHTGDFRANPRMCIHPALRQPENPPIDILYLDTTYLDPKWAFPSQEQTIKTACKIALQHAAEEGNEKINGLERWFGKMSDKLVQQISKENTSLEEMDEVEFNDDVESEGVFEEKDIDIEALVDLPETDQDTKFCVDKPNIYKRVAVVVGSYALGKEKIFISLAKSLKSKIFVTENKRKLLACIGDSELEVMLTDDPRVAQVHVLPIAHLQPEYLVPYFNSIASHFQSLIAFRPTGWTFKARSAQASSMVSSSLARITAQVAEDPPLELPVLLSLPKIKIYGVPYSEHSSFRELASFIASLDIRCIIPTVNVGSEKSRTKMASFFSKWQEEKRKNGKIQVVPYRTLDHW